MHVALVTIAVVIVRTDRGRYRLIALVPLGTVLGVLLFVVAGGPIILITWLSAAFVAILPPTRPTPMPAAPGQP